MPGRLHRAPTRTCVACRTSRDKREFVRIVRTPDGRMTLDPTGRLAGRGAYLCVDPACRRTALTKNILTRALGVPLPDDLRSELEMADKARERIAGVDPAPTHELNTNLELSNTPGGTIGQE
jgi:predicted RNA-binding protein YlxR (DUF448 family)